MWKVTNANIVKTQKVGHLQNRSARGKKKKKSLRDFNKSLFCAWSRVYRNINIKLNDFNWTRTNRNFLTFQIQQAKFSKPYK